MCMYAVLLFNSMKELEIQHVVFNKVALASDRADSVATVLRKIRNENESSLCVMTSPY